MLRLAISCLVLALAPVAAAQSVTAGAIPIPRGIAESDGAFALEADPALLAFTPRYSLVAGHVRSGNDHLDSIGTSVYGAFALSRFGFGLGFDRHDQSGTTGRGRFSLGAAYAPSRAFSMGFAFRVLGSDGSLDGTTALDLSAVVRPSSRLSIALVTRDVLGPVGFDGTRNARVPASFGGHVAFRPFGDGTFTAELGLIASTNGVLSGRLFASVGLLHLGRIYFVGQMQDFFGVASGSLLAGLELRLDGLEASSGVLADDSGGMGFLAYAGIDGRAAHGLVDRRHLVEMRIEGSPSMRAFVGHLLVLDRARLDDEVAGAVLHLHGGGIGLADAQELRYAIARLLEADKPVTCVLESPTGSELYACGGATEVYLDEAGTVRLLGPSVDLVTYGGLLERMGIHADFVRIGAYKTSPERFTNEAPSAESIEQTTRYLDDAYGRLVQDLAGDLDVERAVIRDAIDEGPLGAERARAIGLVDGPLDEADLEDALRELHERSLPLTDGTAIADDGAWGTRPHVALVLVDGPIVDRENVSLPLLGTRATGADTIVAILDRLRRDPTVKAVVLRIDSPGGSALASDRIWRAARRLGEDKPLVASLGGIAASGGYYVATAARTIFADPTTLTGSIGVYYGKIDVAGLAERLGVGITSIERGEHAGALSMFRPFDAGERVHLESLVAESYALFLRRISEGRGRTVESLDGLCEGRIWSGDRAREHGLVDRLGGLAAALAHARTLAELREDAPVRVLPEPSSGLIDRIVGSMVGTDVAPVRMRAIAWLAFAGDPGMLALAPLDRGAR